MLPNNFTHFGSSRCVSRVIGVCVCPCSKRKTTWAIITKLSTVWRHDLGMHWLGGHKVKVMSAWVCRPIWLPRFLVLVLSDVLQWAAYAALQLPHSTAVFTRPEAQADGTHQATAQGQEERTGVGETRGLSTSSCGISASCWPSGRVLAWLYVWSEVQICIFLRWCHCLISIIQIGLIFLVLAHPGIPGRTAIQRVFCCCSANLTPIK